MIRTLMQILMGSLMGILMVIWWDIWWWIQRDGLMTVLNVSRNYSCNLYHLYYISIYLMYFQAGSYDFAGINEPLQDSWHTTRVSRVYCLSQLSVLSSSALSLLLWWCPISLSLQLSGRVAEIWWNCHQLFCLSNKLFMFQNFSFTWPIGCLSVS